MTAADVTVALPVLNEAANIRQALTAIRAQQYATGSLEILVVDGGSEDETVEVIREIEKLDPRIRLLHNPGRFQAPALNTALEEARGEFFLRVDARATIAENYVATCVRLLEEGAAENVGGRMVPVGMGPMGEAIGLATSMPFGLGNSHFHYATQSRFVDTVYLGAWRRQTLVDLGGFDVNAHANEDYELNVRLRAAGGRVLLSQEIRSTYLPRADLRELRQQYTRYGRWKAYTLWKHPGSLKLRQLAPPLLVLGVIAGTLLTLVAPGAEFFLFLLLGTYATAVALSATRVAFPDKIGHLPRLLAIFPTIHFSWGLGLWSEMVRFATGRKVPPRPEAGVSR